MEEAKPLGVGGHPWVQNIPADGSGTIVHTYEMQEPVGCVFEMNDGSLVAGCQSGLRSVPNGELIARIPDASPNIRVNDGKVDPWGNLVLGTMGFPEPRDGAGTLWRWDGQQFSALKDSVTIPNGMVWRPDQSLLSLSTPHAERRNISVWAQD